MKKILLSVFCLFVLGACNNRTTLVADINGGGAELSQTKVDTNVFDKQGHNLVYLLDPSCSVCIGNYINFIESIGSPTCKYDSLFTIVLDGNYLVNVEYYLGREGVYRPENERYIIDDEGSLLEYYQDMSGNNDILLFDCGRLIFSTTVFAYRFEKGVGLVRDIK